MRGVEPTARLVRRPQRRVHDLCGVELPAPRRTAAHRTAPPRMRSAASRPEIKTIGTPTPGWVPEPTNTTLSKARLPAATARSAGTCARRRTACRAAMPRRAQSAGVVQPLDLDRVAEAVVPQRFQSFHDLVAIPRPGDVPVDRRRQVRCRHQHVVRRPAGRCERRVGDRRRRSRAATGRSAALARSISSRNVDCARPARSGSCDAPASAVTGSVEPASSSTQDGE